MASQKKMDKLYTDLRRKYWHKSDNELVWGYVQDDINNLVKYDCLTTFEQARLFEMVVAELDGQGTIDFIKQEQGADLSRMFALPFQN